MMPGAHLLVALVPHADQIYTLGRTVSSQRRRLVLIALDHRKDRFRLIRHAAFGEDSFRFATMLGVSFVPSLPHNLPHLRTLTSLL